ncbi:DUF2490 domain-containing protein [Flavobacterium cerinum]|uniref:DUF2490 domain-containing protein n=1 Tax=Flavobacterium cerinum TaxID=2502784 RepID=A0ABY5IXA4_9FLAO|nr:DUF2490 domain-containing protein [Flavobacterium cerinum]UUC47294.1 DUF2490 domain-containing protein [Flavobacterium cerinum]
MLSTTKTLILFVLFSFLSFENTHAQLSPPGLGKARSAFWSAFGIKQKLDSLGKKETMTYFGLGQKSDPDNYNAFDDQAILVLNHERYHNFKLNQQYSYAVSYRRQNNYESQSPYRSEGVEQEFRVYGRYSYTLDLANQWKWKNTIRQEFRKFYTADFRPADENFQFRTRLKTQLVYHFPSKNKQALALSAEGLFAISKYNTNEKESKFGYKETRLGLYYLFQIPKTPLSMDIGYVNNRIKGYRAAKSGVHYLAVDLIWTIPYRHKLECRI